MIRESLAANSAHVDCHVTSGNGISFQLRATTGGTTTSTIASGISVPYWVRVQRTVTVSPLTVLQTALRGYR